MGREVKVTFDSEELIVVDQLLLGYLRKIHFHIELL
jgi:hypothetical protein